MFCSTVVLVRFLQVTFVTTLRLLVVHQKAALSFGFFAGCLTFLLDVLLEAGRLLNGHKTPV